MSRPLSVLLLEDRQDDARLILHELRRAGFEPAGERVETEADFLARLDPALDLILADYHLPGFDALLALHLVRERGLDVPVIVVTGALGDEAAVECLRQGAADYLLKDRLARLGQAVAQALEKKQARDDQRHAEEALRESEARKKAILETALDGILTIDHQGRILEFNPAAEAIFGYTRADAVGRPLVKLIIPLVWRERHRLHLAHYLVNGDGPTLGRRVETTAIRAGGDEFPIELALTQIREDGRPLFTAYVRDITERKRAEGELRDAKEAAAAANRAKDQFLAILSHELRIPLTPVLMIVSAMLDEPTTAEDIRPTLAMIKDNVELEARLIDDLLDTTRIAQGKMHLNREAVDVHAVIRRALETCRNEINAGRFRLALDLAAGEHRAEADPVRLQQIFWNLVKNAVKFTPAGGEISIRSRNQAGHAPGPTGRCLFVEVSDTGIGIEPAALPKIFRAFEQGDSSLTRRFGGLGLGLAISRAVAEAHGGRLTAASAGKDRGATFTLELPMSTGPAPEPRPRRRSSARPRSPGR